jgi:protocatechuate 4,5-dioxygenase, beta chain
MAELVAVVASTHNPRIFWERDQADKQDLDAMEAGFDRVRTMLAAAEPDVIVVVANDHLDNFFFDNMPTFAVATGPIAEGPFWYETEIMSLPKYRAAVSVDLARYILRSGIEQGIQFSQVHEFRIDHAFTLPLSYLRPEADLGLVPIMTNAFGYPLAANRRWYELGQFLLRAIRAWPGPERVAVLGSFNLNVEVGGPLAGKYKPQFSDWLIERMRIGARDEILDTLTVPRLIEEGNSTAEFLNYVAMLGMVEDMPPSFIAHQPVRGVGTCPLAFWKLDGRR